MPAPVPQGFRTVTPYLVVPDAAKVMDFMHRAFGATERYKMQGPDGAVSHAEMQVGDSVVMLGQSPERDRDIESVQTLIKNCAKVGIPTMVASANRLAAKGSAAT
jgi:PhnB protein